MKSSKSIETVLSLQMNTKMKSSESIATVFQSSPLIGLSNLTHISTEKPKIHMLHKCLHARTQFNTFPKREINPAKREIDPPTKHINTYRICEIFPHRFLSQMKLSAAIIDSFVLVSAILYPVATYDMFKIPIESLKNDKCIFAMRHSPLNCFF